MRLFLLSLIILSNTFAASLNKGISIYRVTPTGPQGELIYGEDAFTGDALPVTILNPNLPGNKVLVKTVMDINKTVNRSYVATTNGCIHNICVGDKVVTGRLTNAVVKAHFQDGTFVARDNIETTRWSYNDLALQEGCTSAFCFGDYVINKKGKEHFIAGFFGNGDYLIRDSKRGRLSIAKPDSIYLLNAVCRDIPIKRKRLCHGH